MIQTYSEYNKTGTTSFRISDDQSSGQLVAALAGRYGYEIKIHSSIGT